MSTRFRFVDGYVAVVTAAGCALLVWFAGSEGLREATAGRGFWLFAFLLLLGEIFTISIPRRGGEVDEVTASTTFAFALLIGFGTPAAVVAQVLASVVADLILRKSPWKTAFNAGQYAISLGAAGFIYYGLGGTMIPGTGMLVPFVVAATAFFLLNTTITDIALALTSGVDLGRFLAKDLVFQAQATLPLLALAPVVVASKDESLWLVPLATAPAIAVWWGTHLALENSRLADRLQGSLDHQQELNRMKDDFVAVVSHELRTPLTSIQGYIKTLLQLSRELPEEQRESFLEAADRQADRLRRMIEQLLVVARLESHVEPLALTWVQLDRLIAQVVGELDAQARGHAFDVRVAGGLPPIETDEAKVHQILSNLVENALKYTPADTRVTIVAEKVDRGVVLSVSDEGAGIPEHARERVFERFYQVDQSTTRSVGGTGLGLYICRKMADTIGAELSLTSPADGGSAFSLRIPPEPPTARDRSAEGGDARGEAEPDPSDQSITASV